MVKEEAEKLREEYLFLIGQKGKDMDYVIDDILIVPLNDPAKGVSDLIDNPSKTFHTGEYIVVVVFDADGNYLFEDIALYTDRKPDKL
jgi:hypothetical protein